MTGPLRRHRVGPVLQLMFDIAQRKNALSRDLLEQLRYALTDLDDEVVGIVITGSGDTFSAGADFAELTGTSADTDYDDAVSAVAVAIMSSPVPVVAALEGHCLGAAAHLALVCDVRIAGEGSYLQVPAVRLGLLYNPDAVQWLARNYPRDTVRRLLVLGERFDDQDAVTAGLITQLVPAGEAAKRAAALLSGLSVEHRKATAATKALLNELDSGIYRDEVWQFRRRELLDSSTRKTAIEQAHRRHSHRPDETES